MTSSVGDSDVAVGVRWRVGGGAEAWTVGVLVDAAVVAFPVDQDGEFRPASVEAIIAAPRPDSGESGEPDEPLVERIAAIRVDLLDPQPPLSGVRVAFATLERPCSRPPDLPATSPRTLVAAIENAGDLWSAVSGLDGGPAGAPPEMPAHLVPEASTLLADGPPEPEPPVRVRAADSAERAAIDWCWLTPRCDLPPE